jgi:hypothetical protein
LPGPGACAHHDVTCPGTDGTSPGSELSAREDGLRPRRQAWRNILPASVIWACCHTERPLGRLTR